MVIFSPHRTILITFTSTSGFLHITPPGQHIMISHWFGHMITRLHDYSHRHLLLSSINTNFELSMKYQFLKLICHWFSYSVPGLYRLLKFGSMMARRDQQGMLTTTLYNFGADVCHTNLAAFVKLQSKGRLLLLYLYSFISYNRTLWVRLIRV